MKNIFKYIIVLVVISLLLSKNAFAQTDLIQGTINHYARVLGLDASRTTISIPAAYDYDRFNAGDTVLIMQMTGISENGQTVGNAGRYEFNIIESRNGLNITLRAPTLIAYDVNSELVQIIRVPTYKNARIVGELTCLQWDRISGRGGVLALFVEDLLQFDHNINVSGKGFKGGAANTTANVMNARQLLPSEFLRLPSNNAGEAGNKGEGAASLSVYNPQTVTTNVRGWGRVANGGGGGAGKWSGGGGGANGGAGGAGGRQSQGSDGWGSVSGFERNYGGEIFFGSRPSDLAVLGGGGGASTGIDSNTDIGSKGGNGGGIVIIIANRMRFAPGTGILAQGESVVDAVAQAGAGGGGGGGSVLLSVNDYDNQNILVDIRGGKGGDIDAEQKRNGADDATKGIGGGGGGGVLQTSGDVAPLFVSDPNRFIRINEGNNGLFTNVNPEYRFEWIYPQHSLVSYPTTGENGTNFANYRAPLNGFFANFIVSSDTTMCHISNESSTTIVASVPIIMGATTQAPNYQWQLSENGIDWTDIGGGTSKDLNHSFEKEVYLRRKITANVLVENAYVTVEDISSPVKFSVFEPIVNAFLEVDDPVFCGYAPVHIEGAPITGGHHENTGYLIRWQISNITPTMWIDIETDEDGGIIFPDPDNDHVSSYRLQRIVESASGCEAYAELSKPITVQPSIKNNTVTSVDMELCEDELIVLSAHEATGGDGSSMNYQWQRLYNDDVWENIDYPESRRQNYHPRPIRDINISVENWYRRVASSGKCVSESDTVKIILHKKPEPATILTQNKVVNFQFSSALQATSPSVGVGFWSSDDETLIFSNPEAANTNVMSLKLGENVINWNVSNGACILTPGIITISVADILIPSGFSPNNDGYNDCFRIVGGENAITSVLLILDRFNNVVYENNDFRGVTLDDGCLQWCNCDGWWDGKNSSGKELQPGTYFYQLTLNEDFVYQGYVELRR